MANTRPLTVEVENHVRTLLEIKHGQPFSKQWLSLISGGIHEFDAVSADGNIVVSIKSASGLTSGGKRPAGKIRDCIAELYFLSLISAPARSLLLTSPDFYSLFMRVMTGKLMPGIEVQHLPLSAEVQAMASLVHQAASAEMSRRPSS